ncbi:MAG: DNA lyase [Nanoarchaeota archaeon]
MEDIFKRYHLEKDKIKMRLEEFKNIHEKDYIYELMFCILTPQSNAKKCWEAVQKIKNLRKADKKGIIKILKTRTRFHNKKSDYLIEALAKWDKINEEIYNKETKELRNFLAENIKGYGFKEASHFLRNIGKSNNKIAILDRHILKNLKELDVISSEKVKSEKDYLSAEEKFLDFSNKVGIPIDELDLLFWSKENGEIFK